MRLACTAKKTCIPHATHRLILQDAGTPKPGSYFFPLEWRSKLQVGITIAISTVHSLRSYSHCAMLFITAFPQGSLHEVLPSNAHSIPLRQFCLRELLAQRPPSESFMGERGFEESPPPVWAGPRQEYTTTVCNFYRGTTSAVPSPLCFPSKRGWPSKLRF